MENCKGECIMYILVDFTDRYGKPHTMSYYDFKDLKNSVVARLDGRGWDDKYKVDFRSLVSCINYIFGNYRNVNCKKSKDDKKFDEYRYGKTSKTP